MFGFEAGFRNMGNARNLRFGASWDHVDAELDSIGASGFGLGGSVSVDCSAIENEIGFDACAEADEKVNVYSVNVYYDFIPGDAMAVRPYVGVGVGGAFFENAGSEFALSGTAGARIRLNDSVYIGGRYRFQWISGPTDELGLEYDNIAVHGLSALLGVNF